MNKAEMTAIRKYFGIDENITNLEEHIAELQELLNDAVHDMKDIEASNINNAGINAQLEYLEVECE